MNEKVEKILLIVVPWIFSWLIRLWFSTCRIRMHGKGFREQAESYDKPIIGTFWHYGIIGQFFVMRNESTVALVSASKDGEYIAKLAHHFGYITVRGSRNKRGTRALKELLRYVKQGNNVGMVADGSQGPPRVVQAGSILLSSKTGSPVLPMIWSSSNFYSVKSWDRTVIPKLFSTIDFFYGEPLLVPDKLDTQGIDEHRLILEKRLNDLYRQAWSIHGRDEH